MARSPSKHPAPRRLRDRTCGRVLGRRFALPLSWVVALAGCIQADDSPSMQAELRTAKRELVEATERLEEATEALVKAGEKLQKADPPKAARASGAGLAARDRFTGAARKIKCSTNVRCTVDEAFFTTASKDTRRLEAQATLRPHRSDGKLRGYEIVELHEGSLLALLGLEEGDVIEKAVDLDLSGPDASHWGDFTTRLPKQKRLSATVRRGAKSFVLRVDVI